MAYSNGANDNFKGVASLFGSGTTSYRKALAWATVTTFAGSVCSIFLARSLRQAFSGRGLVPDQLAGSEYFLLAVAVGAGATVKLATVTGFPISTTHGLTAAIVGAGLMAVGTQVNFGVLSRQFLLPLMLSPLLALILSSAVYVLLRSARLRLGITKEWCVCVGTERQLVPLPHPASALRAQSVPALSFAIDTAGHCSERYTGAFLGISCQRAMDAAHFLSAGSVSFARGLNDVQKSRRCYWCRQHWVLGRAWSCSRWPWPSAACSTAAALRRR